MKILELLTQKRIIGNVGEDATARYLRRKGYKILERNYVAEGYEIDVIAKDKKFLCFIEVKTRTDGHGSDMEPRPAAAVTPEKQRAIISAAKSYIAIFRPEIAIRFDVCEVILNERRKVISLNYIEGAFNANTAFTRR